MSDTKPILFSISYHTEWPGFSSSTSLFISPSISEIWEKSSMSVNGIIWWTNLEIVIILSDMKVSTLSTNPRNTKRINGFFHESHIVFIKLFRRQMLWRFGGEIYFNENSYFIFFAYCFFFFLKYMAPVLIVLF